MDVLFSYWRIFCSYDETSDTNEVSGNFQNEQKNNMAPLKWSCDKSFDISEGVCIHT